MEHDKKQTKYKQRKNWNNESELVLLELWKPRLKKLIEEPRTRPIIEEIALEMLHMGLPFSVLEIKIKMHNLKQKYRKEKLKWTHERVKSDWHLFTHMHEMFQSIKNDNASDETEEYPSIIYDDTEENTLSSQADVPASPQFIKMSHSPTPSFTEETSCYSPPQNSRSSGSTLKRKAPSNVSSMPIIAPERRHSSSLNGIFADPLRESKRLKMPPETSHLNPTILRSSRKKRFEDSVLEHFKNIEMQMKRTNDELERANKELKLKTDKILEIEKKKVQMLQAMAKDTADMKKHFDKFF